MLLVHWLLILRFLILWFLVHWLLILRFLIRSRWSRWFLILWFLVLWLLILRLHVLRLLILWFLVHWLLILRLLVLWLPLVPSVPSAAWDPLVFRVPVLVVLVVPLDYLPLVLVLVIPLVPVLVVPVLVVPHFCWSSFVLLAFRLNSKPKSAKYEINR